MAKIHTHYDNLKVARLAPQEVIRAAYKALSQKYHPDKNPGDEKAARIMAILNSAYGTLADPQRRKEHDEWIAAEEWEIEWLESTHQEDKHNKQRAGAPGQAWSETSTPPPGRYQALRDWKWWCGVSVFFGLGWLGASLMPGQHAVPDALTLVWEGLPGVRHGAKDGASAPAAGAASALASAAASAASTPAVTPPAAPPSEARSEPVADAWAAAKPGPVERQRAEVAKPEIKVVALSQVMLSASPPAECGDEEQAALAPNGEPWPLQSGYVAGFPIGNKGEDLQLTLDNAGNSEPVFIKLYDLDRRSNVRYIFILARDKLTVDQLGFGRYEVRYQQVGKEACAARNAKAAKKPAGF